MEKNENGNKEKNKLNNDYLVSAIRYHFSEFNIWMGFFILINSGLLVAFSSDSLKSDIFVRVLILILGYITSFLFFCASKTFERCIINFSGVINDDYPQYDRYYNPLKKAKVSIAKIVSLFSLILTYAWGIMIFSIICENCKCIEKSFLCCRGIQIALAIFVITIMNLLLWWLINKILLKNIG